MTTPFSVSGNDMKQLRVSKLASKAVCPTLEVTEMTIAGSGWEERKENNSEDVSQKKYTLNG